MEQMLSEQNEAEMAIKHREILPYTYVFCDLINYQVYGKNNILNQNQALEQINENSCESLITPAKDKNAQRFLFGPPSTQRSHLKTNKETKDSAIEEDESATENSGVIGGTAEGLSVDKTIIEIDQEAQQQFQDELEYEIVDVQGHTHRVSKEKGSVKAVKNDEKLQQKLLLQKSEISMLQKENSALKQQFV